MFSRRQWCKNPAGKRCPSFIYYLVMFVLIWNTAAVAKAGLVISVDFNPLVDGIQNTLSVVQGETFTASVVLEYDDAIGLDSYQFSVQFDDSAMTATAAFLFTPAGFESFPTTLTIDGPNIFPFNAASAPLPFNGPTFIAPVVIGTINFTAGMTLGDFSVQPYEDALFDASFDNDGDQILTPEFNFGTVTITAVPEPSSIVLSFVANAFLLRRRPRRLAKIKDILVSRKLPVAEF